VPVCEDVTVIPQYTEYSNGFRALLYCDIALQTTKGKGEVEERKGKERLRHGRGVDALIGREGDYFCLV